MLCQACSMHDLADIILVHVIILHGLFRRDVIVSGLYPLAEFFI